MNISGMVSERKRKARAEWQDWKSHQLRQQGFSGYTEAKPKPIDRPKRQKKSKILRKIGKRFANLATPKVRKRKRLRGLFRREQFKG